MKCPNCKCEHTYRVRLTQKGEQMKCEACKHVWLNKVKQKLPRTTVQMFNGNLDPNHFGGQR